ncbi:MAG: amino acid adenylation domain-containing protein, partial [Bacillota bacterium]|nr:amino acid adenylation domain-containing protein [Bacillota bacterium]
MDWNMSNLENVSKLYKLNNTFLPYDKELTLSELFERQVAATPLNIAVSFGEGNITYSELNVRVNKLARHLREIGVKRGSLVAVILKRSIDLYIAILGVLKAGAAYIPIDPTYPDERAQYMISFSDASLVLTSEEVLSTFTYSGPSLFINDPEILKNEASNLPIINKSEDLAYVIFTSGSTGKPKGVMIEQKSVHNFFRGICELIDFNSSKKILGLTTISFDIFALETFLPLFTGAQIVLANEQQQIDSKLLNNLIIDNEIDMVQITPSRLQMLLAHPKSQESLNIVKEIMVGGEVFPVNLLSKLKNFSHLRIFNMYGPTETTVWSTVKELTNSDRVTIGKPIANTQLFIIDENNSFVKDGEIGELCIAGDGLARGY